MCMIINQKKKLKPRLRYDGLDRVLRAEIKRMGNEEEWVAEAYAWVARV